jgi:glucose/arabinose dehydrogenase
MRILSCATFLITLSAPTLLLSQVSAHTLSYAPGKAITLSLPSGLDINIAASGLQRVRFFAQSPDGRIFATGMHDRSDNTRGSVFILDGWNPQTHTFARVTTYLDHLRNPNNLAFYTDGHGQAWLYLPLTDRLLRYKYNAGDTTPSSPPQLLMRFPDYGLNYKYGGWHLTRTVAIAKLNGETRVYVAAGSSCNYCREREVMRAAIVSMNPDGGDQLVVAQGLRNAVDLRFIPDLDGGSLFATNMGDDHLGDKLPEDTFFELDSNEHPGAIFSVHKTGPVPQGADPMKINDLTIPPPNYGWPTCYFAHGKPTFDTTPVPSVPAPGDASYNAVPTPAYKAAPKGALKTAIDSGAPDPNANLGTAPAPLTNCRNVPAAYTTFAAHSSPPGLAYFGSDNKTLNNSFLVALHGSGHPRIGTGYRLVRFTPGDRTPRDFLTGFLTFDHGKPTVHGRPCGLLRTGPDTFLLTDDYLGLIYSIHPSSTHAAR